MSSIDDLPTPRLRRRLFGGYREADVDVLVGKLELRLSRLQADLEGAVSKRRDLEAEVRTLRSEVETQRMREYELAQAVGNAHRRAAEIEEAAELAAKARLAESEEQAARIRSDATVRTEDLARQVDELLRLKSSISVQLRTVLRDFDHVISRIERGETITPLVTVAAAEAAAAPVATPPPAPAPVAQPAPQPEAALAQRAEPQPAPPPAAEPWPSQAVRPEPADVAPATEPPRAPEPAPVAPPPAPTPEPALATLTVAPGVAVDLVFDKRVELDAGPFADFAALSVFERALTRLPKVEDVYVRRFAGDRAVVELTLSEPLPLLKAMAEFLPYAIDVDTAQRDRLTLSVHATAATGAR